MAPLMNAPGDTARVRGLERTGGGDAVSWSWHPIERVRRQNPTKFFRTAQAVMAILLGLCAPMLFILLIWSLAGGAADPVPAILTIAGLVLLCFFFSYVFVLPDDLTTTSTDRTLAIASKIFTHTRHGLTPEAALATCKIILPETLASAIAFTDGERVLASWGEDSEGAPTGTPVQLETTRRVLASKTMGAFSRDEIGSGEMRFFPHLRAGLVAPIIVRDRCVGTLDLFYPRFNDIDMRQRALAHGFADLISSQLASFELERQDEVTARMELRALQSQVDPHFLFNTIGTIVSFVRTQPDRARSLLIDFSNYYRQTLSDSETLTTLDREVDQGVRYINLMQARYGEDRLVVHSNVEDDVLPRKVPPFILQPLLENCIKHAMRETGPLTIRVAASAVGDAVVVTVEDDGIGMGPEVLAHLFEPRETPAEGPGTITADGSIKRGCGLALSNVLQRLHFFFGDDSGIRVESREGVGTRVTVELVGTPHEFEAVGTV